MVYFYCRYKQKDLQEALKYNTIVVAQGSAGVGKTLLACYHAAKKLHYRDIKKIIDRYDYIIIDGSPQATEIAIATIRASDFILIPMQPSPFDIWASSNLIELVKQGMTKKTELRAGIVLTRMVKNTKIGNEVSQIIHDFELPVLNSRIGQRTCYPYSASLGQTIFDTERPSSEPVAEINALANEINMFLK